LCALQWSADIQAGEPETVGIDTTAEALKVTISGNPFFVYSYDTTASELTRPVIHPLHGPTGAVLTQLGEVAGQRRRHYWHTGLWISHQKFTDGNNWQQDKDPTKKPGQYSRILHRMFNKVTSGNPAQIVEYLEWDSIDGESILIEETRTISVPYRPVDRRVIDFDLVLKAKGKAITLNSTPYHLLAVRAVDCMVPKFNEAAAITNSEGEENPEWLSPAKWIDVSGPVENKVVGISLFNHPKNFRHPTPCLNFGNQLIALSPTEGLKKGFTLEPEKPLRLRFRVLVHAGTAADAGVAREYQSYCEEAGKEE
jgi:hypothetical protein